MSENSQATHDVLSHALLSAEDEQDLAKRVEVGLWAAHLLSSGTPTTSGATDEELRWLAADGVAARDEFISSNYRLALSTARKYRNRGFSDEDLAQDAYAGLVRAVDRFDYAKGFRFSTMAVWWIREALHSGIRDAGFIKHPEVLFNNMVKVRAVKLRLVDELGRTPTVAEIAEQAEMKVKDVTRCLRVDQPISSLHTPVAEDLAVGDLIMDPDADAVLSNVEDRVDTARLRRLIDECLSTMDPMDADILSARFGLDGKGTRSLRQVAEELDLPARKVRTREHAVMAMLRRSQIADRYATFLLSEAN